ncbi:MAG: AsmA family protein [Acidobacteria bacterium]|nr:AsmA family protein [Acidobacteriota bacterium]
MRRPRTSRIMLALAATAVLAVILIFWVGKNYFAAMAREQVVRKLEERYASEVELGDFRLTIFPTIVFEADKLVFRHHGRRDVPPLITVQRIAVSLLPWQLLRNPVRVRLVELTGLEIQVPAGRDADRKRDHADEAEADSAGLGKTGEKYPFLVERIQADGTLLKILPKKQGKEPLTFDIHELSLWSVGTDQPMSFETKLKNAKPPGLINSTGRFGPWDKEDPGLTPVSGTYTFQNADLSVFKGISGKLSSEGKYQGVLERIVVDGWTDTPDFAVKVAGHPVPLKTRFHSIVDGTDGDTLLQPVQGEFLSVALDAKGGVVGTPGVKGKSVKLDVVVAKARVEDLLRLALKPETPPL